MKIFVPIAICGMTALAHASDLTITFDPAKGGCELTELNQIVCDIAAKPRAKAGNGVAFAKSAPLGGKVMFGVPGLDQVSVNAAASDGKLALSWAAAVPAPAPAAPAGGVAAVPAPAPAPGTTPAQLEMPGEVIEGVVDQGKKAAAGATPAPAPAPAPAGSPAAGKTEASNNFVYDYSIPDAPGFFVLGMTPENIVQPRTSRQLAVALKNGVDQSGKLKSGVAVDFLPAQLFSGSVDLQRALDGQETYPKSAMGRILYNTSVSIATVKGNESDDKSVKLGIGVHFPIFDDSDGRNSTALLTCLQAVVNDEKLPTPQAGSGYGKISFSKAAQERAAQCRKDILRWNSTALSFSFGAARVTDSGKLNDTLPATSGAWFNYSYGFRDVGIRALEEHAQLLFAGKAMNKDMLADPRDDKKQISANSRSLTMGFKIGSQDFNGSLNQSFSRISYAGIDGTERVRRWSVGLEYRVAKDIWLVASTGKESGRQFGENQSFVNTGLRFGSDTQAAPAEKK